MTLRVRELTDPERMDVQRIARSHTLGAGLVRRAQIIVHAMDDLKAEAIAIRMDLCGNTVRHWLNRFNARGLEGLKEDVRTGRPPTYSAEQRSAVITAALTRPSERGPAVCIVDPGPPGLLFVRAGHRHAPQPDQRDLHPRGAALAPGRNLVRCAGRSRLCKKRGRSNSSTQRRRRAA